MIFIRRGFEILVAEVGLSCSVPPPLLVTSLTPATAVIDGTLCQLTRQGSRAAAHAPLATAVVEFLPGPLCFYVREHPHGLLPGLPNFYCLDAALRLQWMAEWPESAGACTRIIGADDRSVLVESSTGALLRFEADRGRLIEVMAPMAVAV